MPVLDHWMIVDFGNGPRFQGYVVEHPVFPKDYLIHSSVIDFYIPSKNQFKVRSGKLYSLGPRQEGWREGETDAEILASIPSREITHQDVIDLGT